MGKIKPEYSAANRKEFDKLEKGLTTLLDEVDIEGTPTDNFPLRVKINGLPSMDYIEVSPSNKYGIAKIVRVVFKKESKARTIFSGPEEIGLTIGDQKYSILYESGK